MCGTPNSSRRISTFSAPQRKPDARMRRRVRIDVSKLTTLTHRGGARFILARDQSRRERMGRLWISLVSLATLSLAQPGVKDGEWPSYTADTHGTRYRPLDQINAANFNKLEIAWRFKTDNLGSRPEFKLEGTPLM